MHDYPRHTRQAQRGARLLDKKRPGWESQIDVTTLNMMFAERCILGQLCGNYLTGLVRLRVFNPFRHGFHARSSSFQDFERLKQAWLIEVFRRQYLKESLPDHETVALDAT